MHYQFPNQHLRLHKKVLVHSPKAWDNIDTCCQALKAHWESQFETPSTKRHSKKIHRVHNQHASTYCIFLRERLCLPNDNGVYPTLQSKVVKHKVRATAAQSMMRQKSAPRSFSSGLLQDVVCLKTP